VGVSEEMRVGYIKDWVGYTGVPFKINKGNTVCVGIPGKGVADGEVLIFGIAEAVESGAGVENTELYVGIIGRGDIGVDLFKSTNSIATPINRNIITIASVMISPT